MNARRATNLLETLLATALVVAGVSLSGCRISRCDRIEDRSFTVLPVHTYRRDVPGSGERIAVVGDTQRTSFEGCFLGNEVNDEEQAVLLRDMKQQGPGAVVLLGDMVFQGDSDRHWAYFDHVMRGAGLDELPMFPLLGNHDYSFDKDRALAHVRARFAWPRDVTYYAFSWGNVRMVLLDANRDKFSWSAWQRQMKWLGCEIERVDAGCARGVMLFSHQSPYTQSIWAPDDVDLQRDVLPIFCQSPSKLAYVSAHAHGYERWTDVPVTGCREAHTPFIVSAGGGGPRTERRRPGAACDAATAFGWPRPFNYLVLEQSDQAVAMKARVLQKGETAPADAPGEALVLPLGAAKSKPESCACVP